MLTCFENEYNGAQEKTRTSTTFRPLRPERSASTNSATWAQTGRSLKGGLGGLSNNNIGLRLKLRPEWLNCIDAVEADGASAPMAKWTGIAPKCGPIGGCDPMPPKRWGIAAGDKSGSSDAIVFFVVAPVSRKTGPHPCNSNSQVSPCPWYKADPTSMRP